MYHDLMDACVRIENEPVISYSFKCLMQYLAQEEQDKNGRSAEQETNQKLIIKIDKQGVLRQGIDQRNPDFI